MHRYCAFLFALAGLFLLTLCLQVTWHPAWMCLRRVQWSRDRWRHVTPGSYSLDLKLFEALHLQSRAKQINYNWPPIREHYFSNKTANINVHNIKKFIRLLMATHNVWHFENSKNRRKVILFNSTLTVRWCDGEWYHIFMIFAVFEVSDIACRH